MLDIDFALIIAYLLLLLAVLVLLGTKQPGAWIVSFACMGLLFGWRGLPLWEESRMYFAEIMLWAGCLGALWLSHSHKQDGRPHWPVLYPALLAASALVAVLLAALDGRSPVTILIEFKAFIIFIPTLVLIYLLLNTVRSMEIVFNSLVAVGATISILGVIEYFYPPLATFIPVKTISAEYYRTNATTSEQLRLAAFAFWGTPVVAAGLVPILGITLGLAGGTRGWHRAALFVATAMLIVAIILSGYRSSWLGMLLVLTLVGAMERKKPLLILCGLLLLFFLLPAGFTDRLGTIWKGAEAGDTSLLHRQEMVDVAFQSILKSPLTGNGWAMYSPYNDWVYLALVLGAFGIIPLLLWYGTVLRRLTRIVRTPFGVMETRERALALGLLTGLTGNILSMTSGALTAISPLMISFWVIFCLAARYADLVGSTLPHAQLNGKDPGDGQGKQASLGDRLLLRGFS